MHPEYLDRKVRILVTNKLVTQQTDLYLHILKECRYEHEHIWPSVSCHNLG
jgi:hypothetical protein